MVSRPDLAIIGRTKGVVSSIATPLRIEERVQAVKGVRDKHRTQLLREEKWAEIREIADQLKPGIQHAEPKSDESTVLTHIHRRAGQITKKAQWSIRTFQEYYRALSLTNQATQTENLIEESENVVNASGPALENPRRQRTWREIERTMRHLRDAS